MRAHLSRRWACAALLWSAAAFPAGPREAVALFPFDNIAGSERSVAVLTPLMEKALAARGWKVVSGEAVEAVLEERRVRYLDSLDDVTRSEITARLETGALLFTAVQAWREGENPLVALSSRMVTATGDLLWSDAAAISSADTERILSLGRVTRIEDLAQIAVDQLLRELPRPGDRARAVRGKAGLFSRGPRTFRGAALPKNERKRICILPLEAPGAPVEAARIVGDLLATRLRASKEFEVIEPAAFRAAAREAKIRSFRNIGSTELAALAEKLGSSLFLRGTIYAYRDTPRGGNAFPELQLDLLLVDVRTGQVLWAVNHARKGNDYEGLLLLGSVTNIVSLTDRVVSEMIAAEERTRPRGPVFPTPKAKGPNRP